MLSLHRRLTLVVLLWVFGVEVSSGPLFAEVSYFPIPAISSSKNDGNDIGLIVPILESKPDGTLTSLTAPMIIHNSLLGVRGTFNYFKYWSAGRELEFVGSLTEEIERKIKLRYSDPGFIHGLFAVDVGAQFFKNATDRFFGFGQTSTENAETNYTAKEFVVDVNFGLYLNEVTRVSLLQRYRQVEIQRGGVDTLPFTGSSFGGTAGLGGASILGHRLVFHYDTRDNLTTPTAGLRFTAYAELNQNFQRESTDDPLYFKYGVDIRKLFPTPSKRAVLVVRGNIQLTFGDGIPFYERSSLGGENNLRGFGEDRFIDKHLVVVNIEERFHVFGMNMFNVNTEFEIAPFVDMGRVYNTFNYRQFNEYEITPGIGFRGIVRPNLVGRVDWGLSKDGGAVFAGLDYPF